MTLERGGRLGKGLFELLGDNLESNTGKETVVAVSLLHPSSLQPREIFDDESLKELSDSIRANGIIQPLIVRKSHDKNGYDIIAGERRWRASIMANISEVPVIVRDVTDKQCLELSIIENIQRQDLTPIEEGEAYKRLIEQFSYKHEELATMMGKSRSHITNMIRILSLSPKIKSLLNTKKLSAGHARSLVNVKNAERIATKIIDKGLSVRETEKLVKKMQDQENCIKNCPPNSETVIIEKNLSVKLGVNIKIQELNGSGKIILSFSNLSQLDLLLQKLNS